MRDCPECGKPVDGATCKSCGYSERSSASSHAPVRDPNWGRCEHTYLGQQCAKPGSVSRDSSGPAGEAKWKRAWFCFEHAFNVSRGNAVKEPKPAGTVWPWQHGKAVPIGAISRPALAAAGIVEREPGSDDE